VQAGRDDFRIIENQDIAGAQQSWQIGESMVGPLVRGPIQEHEFRLIASRQGMLGDRFLGQIKIKIRGAHRR
jgi:hypothetical protein